MSEWISVNSKLPREIIDFVLVGRESKETDTEINIGTVMEANLIDGEFVSWRFGMKMVFKNPTHWKPLPKPPKSD